MEKIFTVSSDNAGCRLDSFLTAKLFKFSRSQVTRLIKSEIVTINDKKRKNSYLLKAGDKVRVSEFSQNKALEPYNFDLPIIWEDSHMIVVNKPAGLPTHPHGLNKSETLVNALIGMKKKLFPGQDGRPGVVHRLDKDTTGVILLAKNKRAYQGLVLQFKLRQVKKEYRALTWGLAKEKKMSVKLSLRRKKNKPLEMEVCLDCPQAKSALTKMDVLETGKNLSYLAVYPETGRMHQIRVHLKFLGFPIAGDKKYGTKDNFKNLFLHAYKIKVCHPVSNRFLEFKAPLPEYFQKALRLLRASGI